jgi:nitrite reductase (NADH) small subunit
MNWIRITAAENIPPREGRTVQLGDLQLAIFNTGERFLAVENRCPHGGGPLADGIVGGATVTCPLHNWRICLDSGEVTRPCESGSPAVRTFSVEVVEGVVMLAHDVALIAA